MGKNNKFSLKLNSNLIKQTLLSLVIGGLIFFFLFFMSITIFQLIYNEKIFPGVHVNHTNVGGLSAGEAAVYLTQSYQFSDSGNLTLKYLDENIQVKPEQLGVSLDAVSSSIKAYQFGRSFPITKLLFQQALIFAPHIEIAPIVVFNEQTASDFLKQISGERDKPMIEAGLNIEGTQVTAFSGQIGQVLDIEESLSIIQEQLEKPYPGVINLTVNEYFPEMTDASEFISRAQDILDQPFTIKTPEDDFPKGDWLITPEDLAPMLQFKMSDIEESKITPQLIEKNLFDLLVSISEQVNTPPENPRFIFNDDTRELDLLSDGKNGTTLNIETSMNEIQSVLAKGGHNAVLSFDYQSPDVTNSSTGKELGIIELVHQESSYFYGSDQARIQNIETAAKQFHGLLIASGETFSMADAMDEISLDNGYSEALIIYNGKTIEGVGGGVCQVSTTLFRTAFFSGFPIVERYPHAYRVSYYEKVSGNKRDSNLAGLDATVYIPLIDLKFTNDTPYWLLMETYIYTPDSRLTWKFYSKYDDRLISWTTTGPTNTVEPKKPLYQQNDDLDTGEIKQVDWEAQGADVTVSRSVIRNDELLFQDSFFTRYEPWRAVFEYGPGTEGIPNQNTD